MNICALKIKYGEKGRTTFLVFNPSDSEAAYEANDSDGKLKKNI